MPSPAKTFSRYSGPNALTRDEFRHYLNTTLTGDTSWVKYIVVHHTWKPTPSEWRGMASLDMLQRFYQIDKGWHRGPHAYVTGTAWYLFSPMIAPGVHAKAFNANGLGIETVWNGDANPFSGPTATNLYGGLAELFKRFGLDPKTSLRFHRDDPLAFKSCPGLKVSKADVLTGVLNAGKQAGEPKVVIPRHIEDGIDVPMHLSGVLLPFHGERVDGVTYAPLLPLATALGGGASYAKQSVGPARLIAWARGKTLDLSGEIEISEGRAWIAVRPFAEHFGLTVLWNGHAVDLEETH